MPKITSYRYLSDEMCVRQQLGIHEEDSPPKAVLAEYEKRIRALHRCGITGPMKGGEVMNMLAHLNLLPDDNEPMKINEKPLDWRQVEPGTRVIAKCADRGNLKGTLKACRGIGMLAIDIPSQDPRIQQFSVKDVRIDTGQLDALPKSGMDNDEWDEVPMGTPVVATTETGEIVDGLLAELGPGPARLTLIVDGVKDLVYVDREKTVIREDAMAII